MGEGSMFLKERESHTYNELAYNGEDISSGFEAMIPFEEEDDMSSINVIFAQVIHENITAKEPMQHLNVMRCWQTIGGNDGRQ